jgi:class 3 adenylate cyclase
MSDDVLPSAEPLPAESLASLSSRLVRITIGYSGVAVLSSALLIRLGLAVEDSQPNIFSFLAGTMVTMSVIWCVAVLALWAQLRPIRVFDAMVDGDVKVRARAKVALIRVLNLPLLTVWRILGLHLPILLVLFSVMAMWLPDLLFGLKDTWHIAAVWGLLCVIVPAQAFLEGFAVHFALRPFVAAIRRHGDALSQEQRRQIVPVSVRSKLLFFTLVGTTLPLVVLGLSAAVQVHSLLGPVNQQLAGAVLFRLVYWMALLTVLSSLVTLSMAHLIRRYFGQSADDLIHAMEEVEGGTFTTQLEVMSTDEFAALNEGFNRMTSRLRERGRLREALSRFLSPQLADQMAQKTVCLGGASVNASVLFADIRGFTALSEKMAAHEVVDMLNSYFAAVDPAIHSAGGWINKFGGDSLLAVFGAPEEEPDHARHAIQAALAMRTALKEFNARQTKKSQPTLRIGIGVHCGSLVAGNVGSPKRMEYTVIGDVVNVASRIQSLNKTFNTDILISDAIFDAVGRTLKVREMPPAKVAGKTEQLRVFALV